MIRTDLDSPVGPLTVVLDDDDALTGLYFEGQRHRPADALLGAAATGATGHRFDPVRRQLEEYFSGGRETFDLAVAAAGTPFQRSVWDALTRIPFGATATYGQLATSIGNPRAVRAVGLANGRNPVCIVVPCHRVVGASGALAGFAGGVERKRHLLDLESPLRP